MTLERPDDEPATPPSQPAPDPAVIQEITEYFQNNPNVDQGPVVVPYYPQPSDPPADP